MLRALQVLLATIALVVPTVFADPGIEVSHSQGNMMVRLNGSYAGSYYSVLRSGAEGSGFESLTSDNTLCTGDCFAIDRNVVPGKTYFYRFDLIAPNGDRVRYGPYSVSIPDTPVAARLWPNPGRGATRVQLSLPGGRRQEAVDAEARLLDLQGRTVRLLHRGPLSRGTTEIAWDGKSDDGRALAAGTYFLRFSSPLGNSTTRVTRIR